MDNDLQKQFEERLAELPEDVQEAIASSDFDEKVRAIGKTHNLHIDQIQGLADEAMLAMLGFIEMKDLASGLQEHANIPEQDVQKVADAVTNEIFLPIRESMKAWAESKRVKDAPISAPAAAASPAAATPSVLMPSAPKPPVPEPKLMPVSTPAAIKPPPVVPSVPPKPAPALDLLAADAMLSEKRISAPAAAPLNASGVGRTSQGEVLAKPPAPPAAPAPKPAEIKPQNYKADPYREPVE